MSVCFLLHGRLLLLLLPLPTPTRSIHPPPDNQPIRPHLLIVNQAVLPFWHCGCEFHLCVSCVSVYYSVVLVDIPRYGDVWFVQRAVLMSGSAHSYVNCMLMHLIHEFVYMLSYLMNLFSIQLNYMNSYNILICIYSLTYLNSCIILTILKHLPPSQLL